MKVAQFSTDKPIPFCVVQNAGDYPGAPGLTSLMTVLLSKNAGDMVVANGSIADRGHGRYWLLPDSRDRDAIGPVAMTVLVPAGYIAPGNLGYEVVLGDDDEPSLLTKIDANLRLFVSSSVPASQKGQIV